MILAWVLFGAMVLLVLGVIILVGVMAWRDLQEAKNQE